MAVKLVPINYALVIDDTIEALLNVLEPGKYALVIQGFEAARINKDKKGKWQATNLVNGTPGYTGGYNTLSEVTAASFESFKQAYGKSAT